jgi:hypothetical protein
MTRFRLLIVGWLTLGFTAAGSPGAGGVQQGPVAGESVQRAVINQYCISCHNEKTKSGNLTLNDLNPDNPADNPEIWEKVVRKLRGRMMPPLGRPRPDSKTYDQVISHFESSLDRASAANPDPGRVDTFRRLNRTEYQNAVRDLLALDVDVTSLLPKDDANFGFDNVGVGGLSPTLLERYLSAAQKISRLAVGTPVRTPGANVLVLPPDLTQEDHLEGLPLGTRGGTLMHYAFPVDGEYDIQVRLMRNRNENVEGLTEPHDMEVTVDGERSALFTVAPHRYSVGGVYYADEDVDRNLKVRVAVKAGPHAVGATFIPKTGALIETERQPYVAHFNMDRHPRVQPALYSISVTGPFNATGAGDTPSRKRIFVCRPARASEEERCATSIVSTLARRAYRRPVTDDDIRMPMAFYKDARRDGEFDTGIEMALRAILTSPEFLIRVERDAAGNTSSRPSRVSNVELASRLSFFLWSSIPDDELLDAAVRGKLSEPATLEQQVRRMLADPRSKSLVDSFAEQWLYLRNVAAAIPDARQFPDFDDNLRQAMQRETEMLFESVMREDRNVLDLLSANYTFLNERLAKHYGIPNVYGSHFRRVPLAAGSIRGGLLGQGSILTVTSYGNRTSPVLRGKWILENILGTPPPSPPPNVPPLRENPTVGKVLTMRERMAEHRANPACSSCHQLMDPIGLSMENFDAVGRWRNRGEGDTPIDPAGALPNGATFEGASGLKSALLSQSDAFVTTFTEKLLTYGVGRGLEYYDAPAVRAITREARNNEYKFSSLVLGIVKSTPFQLRRSQ